MRHLRVILGLMALVVVAQAFTLRDKRSFSGASSASSSSSSSSGGSKGPVTNTHSYVTGHGQADASGLAQGFGFNQYQSPFYAPGSPANSWGNTGQWNAYNWSPYSGYPQFGQPVGLNAGQFGGYEGGIGNAFPNVNTGFGFPYFTPPKGADIKRVVGTVDGAKGVFSTSQASLGTDGKGKFELTAGKFPK